MKLYIINEEHINIIIILNSLQCEHCRAVISQPGCQNKTLTLCISANHNMLNLCISTRIICSISTFEYHINFLKRLRSHDIYVTSHVGDNYHFPYSICVAREHSLIMLVLLYVVCRPHHVHFM